MPNDSWHSDTGASSAEDAAAAALLAGTQSPAECPPGLQPAAEVLAALRAGPTSGELAGEAAALAEFRQRAWSPAAVHRSRRRRRSVLTSLLSAKAAAVAAIAAVTLSGAAAAAFTGSMPAPMQRIAHELAGAPAAASTHSARPNSTAHPSPAGPSATGPAAYGLCNAWSHAKAHGTATQRAVAFRNLADAAGGAANVAAFCATVPHPGSPDSGRHHSSGHEHGNPHPGSHHRGKSAEHRSRHHSTQHGDGNPSPEPDSHATSEPRPPAGDTPGVKEHTAQPSQQATTDHTGEPAA